MEPVWHGSKLLGIILGIAINGTNSLKDDVELGDKAISLLDAGYQVSLEKIEKNLIQSLNHYYDLYLANKDIQLFDEWKKAVLALFLDKQISVHALDGTVLQGIVKDVAANGDLLLSINGVITPISFEGTLEIVIE
jgi:biotin-(acetyl-CoA carboxylase) ligase